MVVGCSALISCTTAQYAAMPSRNCVPRNDCSRIPQRRRSRTAAEALANRAAGPDHQEQNDDGADHVRQDAECAVTKARAQESIARRRRRW